MEFFIVNKVKKNKVVQICMFIFKAGKNPYFDFNIRRKLNWA